MFHPGLELDSARCSWALTRSLVLGLQSLYLYNQPDQDRLTSEVPYFCYSHLMMRFDVGPKPANPGPIPTLNVVAPLEQAAVLPPALLEVSRDAHAPGARLHACGA